MTPGAAPSFTFLRASAMGLFRAGRGVVSWRQARADCHVGPGMAAAYGKLAALHVAASRDAAKRTTEAWG